ncbi:tetratricopeptide repeat protein [Microbulbifer sp. THAF38]|uniref:tetratricopeptide repeat protein n=1 Tax=Microbulbifer sp. THAF38 TaxID=2587856 RepID=UPI001269247E|nr:tetratricopeptide repeat protein [Microbulbifer sp. THAF38]QFT55021.1 Anaphase-promoting complex, cyclosome, subunit 3 [Microbulbifer sp. THAF38]
MDKDKSYRRAHELQTSGKLSQALQLYSQLTASSNDPRYFIAYGMCLQDLNHWKQSIAVLKRAIDLKPSYCLPDAQLSLAIAYIKTNRKKEAIKLLSLCAARAPEYPSYDTIPNKAKELLKECK